MIHRDPEEFESFAAAVHQSRLIVRLAGDISECVGESAVAKVKPNSIPPVVPCRARHAAVGAEIQFFFA